MDQITSVASLKNAIQHLEKDQSIKGQLLKDQFLLTYESFRPARFIQSTLKDMVTSPFMLDNLIDTTLSIATGYISKRIVTGASSNVIRRFLGLLIQAGATKYISNHGDAFKSFGLAAIKQIFRKKEKKTIKP